jgi:DNA-binding MarR family transcriptional regulator/GNAT superfamily N-acetyltransferase
MDSTIAAVRAFNRFYTRFAGALEGQFLGSDLTLAEARVLYELATRDRPAASDIGADLGMDAGFLSRVLRRFSQRGWIERRPAADARRREISLSPEGARAFAALDARQRGRVADSVAPLSAGDRALLEQSLGTARALLGSPGRRWTIRPHRIGDMGLITARQAVIYAEMQGWTIGMEALIGEVTAHFLRHYDPAREHCWVAEVDGAMAGSVFLVAAEGSGNVGQLRLLYTEAWARGLGIGTALVDRVVRFAREAGYDEVMLWTHSVLLPARRLYAAAGFEIVSTEIHHEFGKPEPGETWVLKLR